MQTDERKKISEKQALRKQSYGSFSVGWAKAGIAIVRDPDDWGMVGTLDPSALHTPKGFGLGPLTAEI